MMLPEFKIISGNQLCQTCEPQRLSLSSVELPSDGVDLSLGKDAQVRSVGEVLPQQAAGVFVDATLPRAVFHLVFEPALQLWIEA